MTSLSSKDDGSSIDKFVGTSTRDGFGTVTPYLLVCEDHIDDFLTFLSTGFDAKETHRSKGSGGGWHIEMKLGQGEVGGQIMIGTATKTTVPITLFLYVERVDEVFQAAVAAGAKPQMLVQDGFAGETSRGGSVVDPFGFTWYLATETE